MMSGRSHRADALALLRISLNDRSADFREGQWEAVDAVVNHQQQLLVVQRTGWGKSSVYFIATRILRNRGRGPTLIVSPLLALMRNQISAAESLGVKAISINSTNSRDWPGLLEELRSNRADALLVSPERLANDRFVENVLMPMAGSIGLLVVDEAHCISDWGHDFRPDYRRLVNVLKHMPDNMPILGTTATANDRVIADVRAQLGRISVQRGSLMRSSLTLQTMRFPTQTERLSWLAENVNTLPGTGIIYTLTKHDARQVADWLNRYGTASRAYFGGVTYEGFENSDSYRRHLEDILSNNKIKALVATTALGMGYDKPDIGFVIHYQAPGSIIAYYQQVGRAGRGIDNAFGILMSGREDHEIHSHFRRTAFPRETWVQAILSKLEECNGLSIPQIEEMVNLRRNQINQVLKHLSVENPAPVFKEGSIWQRTPIAYEMDHAGILRLTTQREMEWREVQKYVDERGCLMEFLARSLDDPNPKPCGKCAKCMNRSPVATAFSHGTAIRAERFLRRTETEFECKSRIPKDGFPDYKFESILPVALIGEKGRFLSRWGDAGWGHIVAEDKQNGHFRDELVNAVAEMVRERWRPDPSPEWVTCIPSENRPSLVPDLAERLANRLEISFLPLLKKVRTNQQQKDQQNTFHRCRNLDGVFSVSQNPPESAVLLVDDVVDSAWTLTIGAALLRQAGSGPVWPLALATASMGG